MENQVILDDEQLDDIDLPYWDAFIGSESGYYIPRWQMAQMGGTGGMNWYAIVF